jgi:hypothetical protein
MGRPPLARWLVDELNRSYGVVRWLGEHWAINEFHRQHGQLPFAVCSRSAEYAALRSRLELRDAIVILPLEREEIDRYLRRAGPELDGVRAALQRDEVLWELLTTPLFLSVVAVTYRGRSPAEVGEAGTLQELRAAVLADYVQRMLERLPDHPGSGYGRREAAAWLGWLATAMTAHAQSVFTLDLVQPDWLPTALQRRLVTIGVPAGLGVLAGLFTAVVLAIEGSPPIGTTFRVAYVLVSGAALGLGVAIVEYRPGIQPTEQLGWSWPRLWSSLPAHVWLRKTRPTPGPPLARSCILLVTSPCQRAGVTRRTM